MCFVIESRFFLPKKSVRFDILFSRKWAGHRLRMVCLYFNLDRLERLFLLAMQRNMPDKSSEIDVKNTKDNVTLFCINNILSYI